MMTPELQADFAKMRHFWEVQMKDISPTRREWNAPYMAAWLRIEEAFSDLQQTVSDLRTPMVDRPERE